MNPQPENLGKKLNSIICFLLKYICKFSEIDIASLIPTSVNLAISLTVTSRNLLMKLTASIVILGIDFSGKGKSNPTFDHSINNLKAISFTKPLSSDSLEVLI